MKKIIAVAVLATLAACNQSEPAPEPEATEEAAPATTAADGGPSFGLFKVTAADGSVMMSDVREDGTYEETLADGTKETGRWEQKSPEIWCATPDTEGAKQTCYEEHVDANGVYTSKDPATGEVSTVERVVAEPATE